MSGYPYGDLARERRPRPRRRIVRLVLMLVAIAGAFVLGVALGKALDDGPARGKTVTYVRTLQPLPQQPASP